MAFITKLVFKIVSTFFKVVGRLFKFLLSRVFIVAVMIVIQFSIVILMPVFFSNFYKPIKTVLNALSVLAVFWIVSKDENPQFKLSWISLIFFFPLAGGAIYFLLGNRRVPKTLKNHMEQHIADIKHYFPSMRTAHPKEPSNLTHNRYIENLSNYPASTHTKVTYFPLGDDMFKEMILQMEKAEHYIFLEFFILREGLMMDTILSVLEEKMKQGVEVFFLYDDMGSILSLPPRFFDEYEKKGMNVYAFNKFRPHLSPVMNFRDHRKVLVVDGNVAFCGGINIADEYINRIERFGHWKDTGVMLEGYGAWSFSIMFLQQWCFATRKHKDIAQYKPDFKSLPETDGLVQVYGDSPFSPYTLTENVYMTAIRQAKDYIYITTPYVVIDNAMESALCAAAQSGVDVRIITPHLFDKWYVYVLTRSHYAKLIENGVKIYEYTPGFMHGKMFVADDVIATVGTSNMDFRSFYLHFECSVLMYEGSVIQDVKNDILKCIDVSEYITLENAKDTPWYIWILQRFLKFLSPLM